MGLTVFGLMLVAMALSARSETGTVFDEDVVSGRQQLILFGLSLLLIVLSSELGFLQRILGTTPLTGGQWLVCLGFAVALLLLDEVIKIFLPPSRDPDRRPGRSTGRREQPFAGRRGDRRGLKTLTA